MKLLDHIETALNEVTKWPGKVAEALPDLTEISGWAILTLAVLFIKLLLPKK